MWSNMTGMTISAPKSESSVTYCSVVDMPVVMEPQTAQMLQSEKKGALRHTDHCLRRGGYHIFGVRSCLVQSMSPVTFTITVIHI